MMSYRVLSCALVLAALCVSAKATDTKEAVVFCYYGAWANQRDGSGRFGVSDIPTDLCTHVVYSFLGPSATGELLFLDAQLTIDNKSNTIEDFAALKSNSSVKLLVAIGGWSASSDNFTIVVNNDSLRATFVQSLYTFVNTYGLDGIDFDWEYPAQRGGVETDKEQFVALVKELRAVFDSKNPAYLITAAVAVTQSNIDLSYNVPELNKYLDYFNLMCYDYHGTWEDVTGVNAPLYAQLTDASTTEITVNGSVNIWIANGASPSKLVLGLGAYGKTFNLTSLNNTSTGAPHSGAAVAGPYTASSSTWAYYEICSDQTNNKAAWNITEVTGNYVYANRDYFWVGYDNNATIYAKASYAKLMGLAGVMFWSVDQDDFGALCGSNYPLIKQAIEGYTKTVYVQN